MQHISHDVFVKISITLKRFWYNLIAVLLIILPDFLATVYVIYLLYIYMVVVLYYSVFVVLYSNICIQTNALKYMLISQLLSKLLLYFFS